MTAALATETDDLDVARGVLATEAAGLRALAASLDGSFNRAVDLLAAVSGRIVVSGMGKSGHIARKIVPGDAVLALSNSGETVELADLVAHARRFGLPLIGITARPGSTLAEAA